MSDLPKNYKDAYGLGESRMGNAKSSADKLDAAKVFEYAATLGDHWEYLNALNVAMICYRLAGQYNLVDTTHANIMQVLEKDKSAAARQFKARHNRDYAMSRIALAEGASTESERNGFAANARRLLEDSISALDKLNDHEEALVSLGFLGRLESTLGHYDRAAAILANVDAKLRKGDNRVYELNNLMHLIRNVIPILHPSYILRASKLIRETGDKRRRRQLVLLVLSGGRLYGKSPH